MQLSVNMQSIAVERVSGRRALVYPVQAPANQNIKEVKQMMEVEMGTFILASSTINNSTQRRDRIITRDNPLVVTATARRVRVWHRDWSSDLTSLSNPTDASEALVIAMYTLCDDEAYGLLRTLADFVQISGNSWEPLDYHDKSAALAALLFPLYRDMYVWGLDPSMFLDERWRTNLRDLRLLTFKKAVKRITGYDTPRMIKAIGKHCVAKRNVYAGEGAATLAHMGVHPRVPGLTFSDSSMTLTSNMELVCINLFPFTIAAMFKDLVPVDTLYDILDLEVQRIEYVITENILTFRSFLYLLDIPARIRYVRKLGEYYKMKAPSDVIVNTTITRGGHISLNSLTADVAMMYLEYRDKIILPKKYKTVMNLHDDVSRQYTQLQEEKLNKPVEYPAWVEALEKESVAGMRIKLVRHTSELTCWGQQMGHCIASYRDRALSQESILLGVFRGEELVYNAELRYDGQVSYMGQEVAGGQYAVAGNTSIKVLSSHAIRLSVVQLRGKHNASATREDGLEFDKAVAKVTREPGIYYDANIKPGEWV